MPMLTSAVLIPTLLMGCPSADRQVERRPPPTQVVKDPENLGGEAGPTEFQGVLEVDGERILLVRADGTKVELVGIEDRQVWVDRRDRQVTVLGRPDVDSTEPRMLVEGEPRTHAAETSAFVPVREEAQWLGKAGGGKRFVLTPMQGPLGPGHPVLIGMIGVEGDRVVAAVVDDGKAIRHRLDHGWALFKPIGSLVANADDDIDLEFIFLADWVKDGSPGATVIQRHNVVLDYTGSELRQLPDVEAALADAQTPAAIRTVLRDRREAAASAPATGGEPGAEPAGAADSEG